MTSAVLRKEHEARPAVLSSRAGLVADRTDIVFANVAPDRVQIEITVHNHGAVPTPATEAVISAAVLGAFVPWQPLATVAIPPLLPGDSHRLRLQAVPPPLAPGAPDRLTPHRLRTALANEDDPDARKRRRTTNQLPADVFSLLGLGGIHWAGNLNIFFAGKEVERHLAQALRIYPGRTNVAMFIVGARRDRYAFSLHGSGAVWDTELHDLSKAARFEVDRRTALPLNDWIKVGELATLVLALRPPVDAQSGEVQVHVEQRSTGKKAVVEFSLDARAAGPGCFVVS
jgi:hypothetical protein